MGFASWIFSLFIINNKSGNYNLTQLTFLITRIFYIPCDYSNGLSNRLIKTFLMNSLLTFVIIKWNKNKIKVNLGNVLSYSELNL